MATRTVKEREPDPPAQIEALARDFAGTELPRALLVRGDERWFREAALQIALAAAGRLSMDVARYDALDPDFSLANACADLSAPPMFASARMVMVRNAMGLLAKVDGEDPPLVRAALAFLKDRANPGILALEAAGLRIDHALAKSALAAGGRVVTLRRLWDTPAPWRPESRETELVLWLVGRARKRGVPLTNDEAIYVATATGNDLHALEATLEQLAKRGSKSVRELVGWTSTTSPFELAEWLCRGDVQKSVAGIENLFRQGFQDKTGGRGVDAAGLQAILSGQLRSKLRTSLTGALALERGLNLGEAVALALGSSASGRARQEFEARIRDRDARGWRQMLEDLNDLERDSRRNVQVDANDFVRLALRWRRAERARR